MSRRILSKKPLILIYSAGIILLAVAGWLWCAKLSMDPQRVFWQTLDQSLSTTGVTVKSSQDNANGVVATQLLQYSFGADTMSHAVTTLKQGNTTVVDEVIGTPKADYTRYLTLKTDQKGADGKPLKFPNVIGVWASSGESGGQLLPQSIIGTSLPLGGVSLPIAQLDSRTRAALVDQIRQDTVYKIDFSKVKKQHIDGRLQYVYDVKMPAVAYAKMMKQFAAYAGVNDLKQLDPSTFAGRPDFAMRLTIDARAHHVIAAAGLADGKTTVSQKYVSYDVPVVVEPPTKTISLQELQQRLSKPE